MERLEPLRLPAIAKKPRAYFAKFVAVSAKADTDRPEITQAKTFLAKK